MSVPTLEVKLRTAALSNPGLTSLLGSGSNNFRWWDSQLTQDSDMPGVVVIRVSGAPLNTTAGRNPLELARMQFTIWGQTGEQARQVEAALLSFLDTFSATGLSGASSTVVNIRGGGYAQTSPIRYWRTIDAMIYNSDSQ